MTMGFVETLSSKGAVPLSSIQRIEVDKANENGVLLRKVILADGAVFETFATENEGLLMRPIQIIPAQADTKMIRVWVGDQGEAETYRTPVVAWALCLDGEIRPVTPNGVNDAAGESTNGIYVELPNDQIEAVGQWQDPPGFKNASEMVDHFVTRRREFFQAAAGEDKA